MRIAAYCPAIFAVVLASCATESGDVGSPCDTAEDCADDLVCDVHDGKGTCQEDHGHGESGESGESTGAAD